MKHLFTMLLALIVATASAQDFEVDGIYYNILSEDDRTVEVIKRPDKYKGNIVIPAEVTYDGSTYSVTTIGEEAFYWCDNLTSVSMPSVTTIDDWAFYWCFALESVDIPASCTSIGSYPFAGCTALKEIVVDDNNPNYSSADGVLYDKGKTTLLSWPTAKGGINLPLSVTKIGVGAFCNCWNLTSVSMPSVTTIGERAFYYCDALTSVSMPVATTIGDWAFSYCDKLTSVSMPAVTTIGDLAFENCDKLTSVSMPAVTTIGGSAFYSCDGLTSVEMPEVSMVGAGAFAYCNALTSVSMPAATTIGKSAFKHCRALRSVSMPSVTTIGEQAFYCCDALPSVSMPEAMTIGDWAFSYCFFLRSIDIPASVTMIGSGAFDGCNSLTSVYCHWEQPLECNTWFEDEVTATATLYVPDGCVGAYRSVYPWSEFANIEEGGYSGIADATVSEVVIKVIDGAITVEGGDGTASAPVVEVYSAGGACVYRGTDSSIGGLTHGVYVVKVGDMVQKVAL